MKAEGLCSANSSTQLTPALCHLPVQYQEPGALYYPVSIITATLVVTLTSKRVSTISKQSG